LSAIVLALVPTVACDVPHDRDVAQAFRKSHPTYTVTAMYSGEGDSDTVYKHIRYRQPDKAVECEVVWGYQKDESAWRVFYKGEPALAGTVCEGCVRKPCE
jgi:hypothetical protein